MRPAPGASRAVARLDPTRELIDLAAREVAPLVESVTGWRELLAGVRFELLSVDSGFHAAAEERVYRAAGVWDSATAERARLYAERWAAHHAAIWDFGKGAIYLNARLIRRQNLDALKVTIGHELVHVGQTRNHPQLAEAMERAWVEYWRDPKGTVSPESWRLMANLEGYAEYIEREFLRREYTHATKIIDGATRAEARLEARRIEREVARRFAALRRDLQTGQWSTALTASSDPLACGKEEQYLAGLTVYRERGRASIARFDPELRPEPLVDEQFLVALALRAADGCVLSQTALGDLYLGRLPGMPRDLELARFWFHAAARRGFPLAAFSLASLMAENDPEREHWLRAAADAGFVPAQLEMTRRLAAELVPGLFEARPEPATEILSDLIGTGAPPPTVDALERTLRIELTDASVRIEGTLGRFSGSPPEKGVVTGVSGRFAWDMYHERPVASLSELRQRSLLELSVDLSVEASVMEERLEHVLGQGRDVAEGRLFGGWHLRRRADPAGACTVTFYTTLPDWAAEPADESLRARYLSDLARAPSVLPAPPEGSGLTQTSEATLELAPPMSALELCRAFGWSNVVGQAVGVHQSSWSLRILTEPAKTELPTLGPWSVTAELGARPTGGLAVPGGPPGGLHTLGPVDVIRRLTFR